MADIIQAAKWMQEGKVVKRPDWPYENKMDGIYMNLRTQSDLLGRVGSLCWLGNLLANDWEIAE